MSFEFKTSTVGLLSTGAAVGIIGGGGGGLIFFFLRFFLLGGFTTSSITSLNSLPKQTSQQAFGIVVSATSISVPQFKHLYNLVMVFWG